MLYNLLFILWSFNLHFKLAVSKCSSTEWRCPNGQCIPNTWLCDYEEDCSDGADERQNCGACKDSGYLCRGDGKCIAQKWVCDGWVDCIDGDDEANCATMSATSEPLTWRECEKLQKTMWLGFVLTTDTSEDPKAQVYWVEPSIHGKGHVMVSSDSKPGDPFSIGKHVVTYVAKTNKTDEGIFCNIPLMVLGNMQSSQLQICYDIGEEETGFLTLLVDSGNYEITSYAIPNADFDSIDRYYTPEISNCYAKIAMEEIDESKSSEGTGEWMVEHKWPIALLIGCILGLCFICIGSIVYWDSSVLKKQSRKNYERVKSDRENSVESSSCDSESEEREENKTRKHKNKRYASMPPQSVQPSTVHPSRIPQDRRAVSMDMYGMEVAPNTRPMTYLIAPNGHPISISSAPSISAPSSIIVPPGHNRNLSVPIRAVSSVPPNVISVPVRHPSFSVTPSQIYQSNDANMTDFLQLSQLQSQSQLQLQQQQQPLYIHSDSRSHPQSQPQIPQPQPQIQPQPQTQPQIQPQTQPQSQVAISRNENHDYISQPIQSKSSTRRQTVCGFDLENLAQQSNNNRTPKEKESSRKKMAWLQTPGRETDAVKEMLEQDSQEDSIGSGSRPPSEML